jgi:hypothetical protein
MADLVQRGGADLERGMKALGGFKRSKTDKAQGGRAL